MRRDGLGWSHKGGTPLVSARQLGEVLDKADQDHDERPNEADEEEPTGKAHGVQSKGDHPCIINAGLASPGCGMLVKSNPGLSVDGFVA